VDRDAIVSAVMLLAEALEAADDELSQLDGLKVPLPHSISEALDERLVLIATLRRAPAKVRDQLVAIYREERDSGEHIADTPDTEVPVDQEVMERLAALHELLRRAALVDEDVRAILRDAGVARWWGAIA